MYHMISYSFYLAKNYGNFCIAKIAITALGYWITFIIVDSIAVFQPWSLSDIPSSSAFVSHLAWSSLFNLSGLYHLRFWNSGFFTGWSHQPHTQPPIWRTSLCIYFLWRLGDSAVPFHMITFYNPYELMVFPVTHVGIKTKYTK